jgi:plasmid stability protein
VPNLLLRNLDEELLRSLKAAAQAHGRSLQAEIHAALRSAQAADLGPARALSQKWLRRLAGRHHSDSAALLRQERDAR